MTYTKLVQEADNSRPANLIDVGAFYRDHGARLGPVPASVLLYLLGESREGVVEASPKAIGAGIGSSRMTIVRALERLEALGAIAQASGRATRPGLWFLSDTYTKLVQAGNALYQDGTTILVQVNHTNTNLIQAEPPADTRDKGTSPEDSRKPSSEEEGGQSHAVACSPCGGAEWFGEADPVEPNGKPSRTFAAVEWSEPKRGRAANSRRYAELYDRRAAESPLWRARLDALVRVCGWASKLTGLTVGGERDDYAELEQGVEFLMAEDATKEQVHVFGWRYAKNWRRGRDGKAYPLRPRKVVECWGWAFYEGSEVDFDEDGARIERAEENRNGAQSQTDRRRTSKIHDWADEAYGDGSRGSASAGGPSDPRPGLPRYEPGTPGRDGAGADRRELAGDPRAGADGPTGRVVSIGDAAARRVRDALRA